MADDAAAKKRKRIRTVQRYLVNPPAKVTVWCGLVPGFVIVETVGRRSGKRRLNVVGMKVEGDTGWVIAEYGRRAGYVNNLDTNPDVRVRMHRRWRRARSRASSTTTIRRPGSSRSTAAPTRPPSGPSAPISSRSSSSSSRHSGPQSTGVRLGTPPDSSARQGVRPCAHRSTSTRRSHARAARRHCGCDDRNPPRAHAGS